MTRPSSPPELLEEAERQLSVSPRSALTQLEQLASSPDVDTRASALALLAIQEATLRSEGALARAEALVATAEGLAGLASFARGRLAHARGYIAHRRSNDPAAVRELNLAATLYGDVPRLRARVFDLLGMLLTRRGDLDGAYDYFMLSLSLKQGEGPAAEPGALALTFGNLGRLELARERYAQAEGWLRKDLSLVLAGPHRPATEAHVRNQLALALLGQGRAGRAEAREELERARALAPDGSISKVYVLKDLAALALDERRDAEARALVVEAAGAATRQGFAELRPWLRFLEARLALRGEAPGDGAAALSAFEEAWRLFGERHMPQEACEVAIAWSNALLESGAHAGSVAVLEKAQQMAEVHLFRQENPLSRIEEMLDQSGSDGPASVLRARVRRMLGGVSEHWLLERHSSEYHARRLLGERAYVTVWTCDIRGFTEFCNQTHEPQRVVKMLNRFFARVGQAILGQGGCIDKYVGDSILAYFQGPGAALAAAETSLEAIRRVADLNAERVHLGESALQTGIGIATGWVVEGNVGFAGKLEHTIIGTPVNTACRLVAKANAEQVLLDAATRTALGDRFSLRAVPGDTLELKGLGQVAAFELLGLAPRGS